MKRQEQIPEKIYVHKSQYWGLMANEHNITKDGIEYTSTDAFIERACEWLKNHYRDYMHNPTGKKLEAFFGGDMCNDFENYMKGE